MRYDYEFLKYLIDNIVRLYPRVNNEERMILSDLKDYITWLCIDAIEKDTLAISLKQILVKLLEEIEEDIDNYHFFRFDTSGLVHYGMFIQALILTLTCKHGTRSLLCKDIDHHKFLDSWNQTKLKLGLTDLSHYIYCETTYTPIQVKRK